MESRLFDKIMGLGDGGNRDGWVWEGGSRLFHKFMGLGREKVGLVGFGKEGADCCKKSLF